MTNSQEISDAEIFLEMMAAHSDDIRVDRITLELTQDLPAAAVLSRLAYWFSPSKNGQKRTRIRKDGKDWVAKGDEDWWEECGVTAKQMKRIKRLLIDLGVIDTIVKKFDGNPTTHYYLNLETYFILYKEKAKINISNCTKGTKGNVPKGRNDQSQRYKTITREHKQETYSLELDNTKGSGQARILSLINICFDSVFSSQSKAFNWMIQLGVTQGVARGLVEGFELYNLRAGAEYLKKYLYKALEEKKKGVKVAAYFVQIMKKRYYLEKR